MSSAPLPGLAQRAACVHVCYVHWSRRASACVRASSVFVIVLVVGRVGVVDRSSVAEPGVGEFVSSWSQDGMVNIKPQSPTSSLSINLGGVLEFIGCIFSLQQRS